MQERVPWYGALNSTFNIFVVCYVFNRTMRMTLIDSGKHSARHLCGRTRVRSLPQGVLVCLYLEGIPE